ncbi:undecaprenyl-phosphate glucose phosphotransferase [Neiella marina]|uniref:Undecaprenyl-phosphate glucose phosphotransferase n=1 Tax=Neiella holothuriorum TaxID=2870530 RepID=A0ABS7EE41_9GAMM|nr:undecaprenyl-phosphate glucose phosphotransferase [Neiella holothuriorum]MBW8190588.1 undecaprenyl-phosphate glucose phosphotransferase [Neiella holothuriorum]
MDKELASNSGFIRSHQEQFTFFYKVVDLLIVFSSLFLTNGYFSLGMSSGELLTVALISVVAFIFVSQSMDLYRSWRFATFKELLSTASLTNLVTFSVIGIAIYYINVVSLMQIEVMLFWFASVCGISVFWRMILREVLKLMRRKGHNARRAIILGLTESGMNLERSLMNNEQLGVRMMGFFEDRNPERFEPPMREKIVGTIEQAIEKAKNGEIDLIYIAMPLKAEKRISEIINRCADSTVDVHIVPNLVMYKILNSRWYGVGNVQTLSVFDSPLAGPSIWQKRMFDVASCGLGLLLISPLMLLIALLVKATSKGPIFYGQIRIGADGKEFKMWKFRSMTTGGENHQGWTVKDDPRVTTVGKYLRKTSLDELPQLWNVVIGDMSLIGPRPERPMYVEQFRKEIPYYMLRHKMKSGITGWAQINGWRGDTSISKRIECDIWYIKNWSFGLDLSIVFKTFWKGLVNKNAY